MKDSITTFKLNWYNCGLCCADDVVQEEIAIYRNRKLLTLSKFNGYDIRVSCTRVHVEKEAVNNFFLFLEESCVNWKSDYKVTVCDGSEWKLHLWHSSHKTTVVCGTIKYPPEGIKIEEYIRSLIKSDIIGVDPVIFGCVK